MSARREGLRTSKPKPVVRVAKSNAEKCADYLARLKQKPEEYKVYLKKKEAANCRYLNKRTEEQKARARECSRLRQQKRRKLKKQQEKKNAAAEKPTPVIGKPTTRAENQKEQEKIQRMRENARQRQRKRRANMSAEENLREAEKRKERYRITKARKAWQKLKAGMTQQVQKNPKRFTYLLKSTLKKLRHRRDRQSLVQLKLLKGIVNGQVDLPFGKQDKLYPLHHKTERRVEDFYINAAIDLPGKKSASFTNLTQRKVLTKRVEDLFKEFKGKNPNYKISLATFSRRRPKHVLLSSSRAFLQCLCEVCVNPMLKMNKLNPYLSSKMKHVEDLVNSTLCTAEEFSRSCIDRECDNCGVDTVIQKWKQEVGGKLQEEISWFRWEKTTQSGKDQVEKSGTLEHMIDELKQEMQNLALHEKTAKWQRQQYQQLIASLPVGHSVVTVDFAENYLCKFQNEVQSAHWSYRQVSVHPCVLQYHCSKTGCDHIVTDYVVFLSDDLKHDAAFTKNVMSRVLERLASKGIKSVSIFSDGCSSQYKSKLPFVHLGELAQSFPDLNIQRHFFGSHHGKSLCDSCGGVVKNCVTRAVASGRVVVQNAGQMFAFCEANMQNLDSEDKCCHALRSFEIIPPVNRNIHSDDYTTLKGTRAMHSIKPDKLEPGKLFKKKLSCFCAACLTTSHGCPNVHFTGHWEECKVEKKRHVLRQKPAPRHQQAPCRQPAPHRQQATNVLSSSSVPCLSESSPPAQSTPHCPQSTVAPSVPLPAPTEITQQSSTSRRDRRRFFADSQRALEKASCVADLQALCLDINTRLETYQIKPNSPSDRFSIDTMAVSLLSESLCLQYVPIEVIGDGNCFFRSASFLAFGTQDDHTEFRVRVTCDMVVNESLYTDPDYLKRSSECSEDIIQFLLLFAAAGVDRTASIKDLFWLEVMAVRKSATYCGLWQMFAMANILSCNYRSIYPLLGEKPVHCMMNTTIYPSSGKAKRTEAVMWTSNRTDMQENYWVANHVVPLLPIQTAVQSSHTSAASTASHTVGVDNFYVVVWSDAKQYVCQVKEIDEENEMLKVHFMQQVGQRNIYIWPVQPDESWEPTTFVTTAPVHMTLLEHLSTQRKQYYAIQD